MTRRRLILLLGLLLVALAAVPTTRVLGLTGGGQAEAEAAPCGGVAVGPAQVVVSDATRDALGLNGWADSAFGVLRDADGGYRFVGPGFGSGYPPQRVAVTRGTLDNPVAGGVVAAAAVAGAPPGYIWVGGGPMYRDPASGIVLQVLHLEQELPNFRFYATLHLGRFDPATGQTRYLGPIVRPELDYATAKALDWNADVGTSSLTVAGGYLQVYFPDYHTVNGGTAVAATALSTARAPLADVLAAARAGQVVPWRKYHDGGWDSPALGGPSSAIRSGHDPWGPHVVRTSGGASIMVAGISSQAMVLSSSPDGISGWSSEVPLFSEPRAFIAYPTLVGLGSDPSVVGSRFYLYYTQFESVDPDWSNVTIRRRLVTCTAGQPASPVPLLRYAGNGHRVTTAPLSAPGLYPEYGGLWYLLDAQTADTRAIYGCRAGARDYFLSTDPGCEGAANAILQTEGWIHTAPPDAPSTALYRCYLPGANDHFVSVHASCESPNAVQQGLLGYALTTSKVTFSRFSRNGGEHWETTGPISAPYASEGRWFLERVAAPGTVPLYGCAYPTPLGTNHFISVRSDCEGTTLLRTEGWIHTAPPADRPSTPLYRCYWPAQYDHFLSASTTCEGVPGVVREGLMGYAETG